MTAVRLVSLTHVVLSCVIMFYSNVVFVILLLHGELHFSPTKAETNKEESIEIQLTNGPIKGVKFISSWTQGIVFAFRGIPYASPPIGRLRFKDPVPPQKWTEVKDCTADQFSCIQPDEMLKSVKNITSSELNKWLSEDCLYLNVFTSELHPPEGPRPVLVWVHGGGFIVGSGNWFTGPDFLVAEGVVVVTMNYRLGAFGFLTLGSADAPGNLGLKDQRLSFLWVQQEIEKFGGDPGRVTIFGESAGSASVHLHYLSPLSKGLFHRVIGDSGTGLSSWAVVEDGSYSGLQLAEKLNCRNTAKNMTSMANIIKCMESVDAMDILKAQSNIKAPKDNGGVIIRFGPSVDKWSTEPILPLMPTKLFEQKQGSFVPFIMGINKDEGTLFLLDGKEKMKKDFANISNVIPRELRLQEKCDEKRLKNIQKDISNFYFNGSTPSSSNLRGFINLITDTVFTYSTAVSARKFRERNDVYLFYFTFDGDFKYKGFKRWIPKLNMSIVSHAEEINYLFFNDDVNHAAKEDSAEVITRKRMVRLWTNFVKYGVPTNKLDPLLQNVRWLPITNTSTRFLHIGDDLTMVNDDFLGKRVAFWDRVSTCSACNLQSTFYCIALLFILLQFR